MIVQNSLHWPAAIASANQEFSSNAESLRPFVGGQCLSVERKALDVSSVIHLLKVRRNYILAKPS